jgi:ParB family chromosome partitioning protein
MSNPKALKHVSPNYIIKNPENPRVIFREDELDTLMRSIDQVGIQVPLSVYERKNKFVLIDGERRWRCALKLGLKDVPVIVEPKPTPLNNLLMMFNIHNVRIHWDLIALAFKIEKVRELVKKERRIDLSKKDLADLTGVNSATIMRCVDLLLLPKKYKDLIWKELEKPKGEQKYTEDLFIEIKKSIKTIENYLPEITRKYKSSKLLDVFFEKYHKGIETNRVKFRDISKIARAESLGISKNKILSALIKYVKDFKYTIEDAFQDSAADAYSERSTEKKIYSILTILKETEYLEENDELRLQLADLRQQINRLLK